MKPLEEGDECPYCEAGILKPTEDCSCHINTPCIACTEASLVCGVCGAEIESQEE